MSIKKIPLNEPVVMPVENFNIVELAEQLNGLIDRYKIAFDIYHKANYIPNAELLKSLEQTLENIGNAINALCLRITERQFILHTD